MCNELNHGCQTTNDHRNNVEDPRFNENSQDLSVSVNVVDEGLSSTIRRVIIKVPISVIAIETANNEMRNMETSIPPTFES